MSQRMGAYARFKAIQRVSQKVPQKISFPVSTNGKRLSSSQIYGCHTFGLPQLKKALTPTYFKELENSVRSGKRLPLQVAHQIARVFKEWALSKEATHFCHWFQPQTGFTAEKHESFLELKPNGQALENFTGNQLIRSEPDASSFPSGGARSTFEARGYTAWDPTSPVFVAEFYGAKTLCIPSVFVSHQGDALDEKTGLLRSIEVLSENMKELLYLLGLKKVDQVRVQLGIEQEYFLLDQDFFSLRPDLKVTGRTLLGCCSPKSQELGNHYFGSIPSRVLAFMNEVDLELYKLGIPAKTRHNEVAPNQFEIAPIYEEANIAVDHNQLIMEILRKVAQKHSFTALLHEKPFLGINGSGKHINWSLAIQSQDAKINQWNLLDPQKNQTGAPVFLITLLSMMRGILKYSDLLLAGVASAGNDHRLGASEAPPAILSMFLGEKITRLFQQIMADDVSLSSLGSSFGQVIEKSSIQLGIHPIAEVEKDDSDRNRTSPLAFTGSKFEWRATGSSASVAFPVTLFNTVVSEGVSRTIQDLKKKRGLLKKSKSKKNENSIYLELIRELVQETASICFEGDSYSSSWREEAKARRLPSPQNGAEALYALVQPQSKELFHSFHIFSEAEIEARYQVRMDRYFKTLETELRVLKQMVDTQVLPAAYSYLANLSHLALSLQKLQVQPPQIQKIEKITQWVGVLQEKSSQLGSVLSSLDHGKDSHGGGHPSLQENQKKMHLFAAEISRLMVEVRKECDLLESQTDDGDWPLPKYTEMFFSAQS